MNGGVAENLAEMARPNEASTGPGAWPRIALALAPLLALLAYWNSLGGGFVWDDRTLILDGNLGSAWARLGHPARGPGAWFSSCE